MITPNKKQNTFITPEKAASFIPIFISAGISILIISFFVVPEYFKSTKVNLELNGLIKKKNELNNLKSQYKIINSKFEKLNKEKTKIIELITGRSNLDTLLAELGKLGRKNNIEFLSIAPQRLVVSDENSVEKNLSNNLLTIGILGAIDPIRKDYNLIHDFVKNNKTKMDFSGPLDKTK